MYTCIYINITHITMSISRQMSDYLESVGATDPIFNYPLSVDERMVLLKLRNRIAKKGGYDLAGQRWDDWYYTLEKVMKVDNPEEFSGRYKYEVRNDRFELIGWGYKTYGNNIPDVNFAGIAEIANEYLLNTQS